MLEFILLACSTFHSVVGGMAVEAAKQMEDGIDWVAYYKEHGSDVTVFSSNCQSRIQYAPVFVSPTMQWAVPNSCLSAPPGSPGSSSMTGN